MTGGRICMKAASASKKKGVLKKTRNSRTIWNYHIMVLIGMVWLFFFNIVPMFGIVIAFEDYNPMSGLWHSDFVGMENFAYLFSMSDCKRVIINTLVIAVAKLILNIIVPLAFALLLNEIRQVKFKKAVQTIVYLPRFRQLVIGSDVWKEFGFNAVIYLAALTGISPELYEAAAIDGCSRWKAVWNITIPGIASTIVVLSILGLGNVLNAGFDQVFNLYSPLVYSTGDILDTWVYRMGLLNVQFSLATAAGLFKSVISFTLIVISYIVAYKAADYKIF